MYLNDNPTNLIEGHGYASHYSYTGFIKQEYYDLLLEFFPPDELFKDEEPETRKNGQRPHWRRFMYVGADRWKNLSPYRVQIDDLPLIWRNFCRFMLEGSEYKKYVCKLLGVKNCDLRLDFHRTCQGRDASPHLDSLEKIGSHLFYFLPQRWKQYYGGNTILYTGLKKDIMNPEPRDFEHKKVFENRGNSSFIFKNTREAWHGVSLVRCPKGMHRQILNVVILKCAE